MAFKIAVFGHRRLSSLSFSYFTGKQKKSVFSFTPGTQSDLLNGYDPKQRENWDVSGRFLPLTLLVPEVAWPGCVQSQPGGDGLADATEIWTSNQEPLPPHTYPCTKLL